MKKFGTRLISAVLAGCMDGFCPSGKCICRWGQALKPA